MQLLCLRCIANHHMYYIGVTCLYIKYYRLYLRIVLSYCLLLFIIFLMSHSIHSRADFFTEGITYNTQLQLYYIRLHIRILLFYFSLQHNSTWAHTHARVSLKALDVPFLARGIPQESPLGIYASDLVTD